MFEFDELKAYNVVMSERQYRDAVDNYFGDVKPTKSEFLDGFGSWPNSLFSIIQNYISVMIMAESAHNFERGLLTHFEFDQNYLNYEYLTTDFADSWQAAFDLERHVKALNITIAELRQALGKAFIEKFQLSIDVFEQFNGNLQRRNITDIDVSYIDWWWACYSVDLARSGVVLSSAREYVQISVDASEQAFRRNIYR